MSTGASRRVSREDIQLVQNLIERCLQLYMNQREVVETLLVQAKIEPGFTELVWKKLEEENQEFFKAYYLRLMVKQQINEFNRLLEQQVSLMHQMPSTGVALPATNGTSMSLHQNSTCYATEHTGGAIKPENIQHHLGPTISNAFTNGGPSLHSTLHAAVEMSSHTNRIEAPSNLINQSSNMGLMQGMNGGIIKTEAGFSGGSPYMFGAENNVLDSRPAIADAPIASFSSVESNAQPLNESLLDPDASFGLLGQIPRIFSLSDLTADFSQSSDILESYPRSPFLATDNDNFLDSREREQGDGRRLDPVSEGLSYDDFCSE